MDGPVPDDRPSPPVPANDVERSQLEGGLAIFHPSRAFAGIVPLEEPIMDLSSVACRKQEAHHRERAAATDLDNVRRIEERAASVWASEAMVADRREARRAAAAAAASVPKPDSEPDEADDTDASGLRVRTNWSNILAERPPVSQPDPA